MDLKTLAHDAIAGKRLALSRLITKIENRVPELHQVIPELYSAGGKAQIWGITGPPGAGKSTLVDQLLKSLRAQKKRVAVIAVDPSSPFTGGAILGDRIRMQDHATDPGVYIRSLGTRGRHGGLSHATKEVFMALDAAGFDVVLVETAGVGQTELDIMKLAQTVVVALVPESGDSIQVMKAGLMEIADVFVVNKCDRPEADKLVRELVNMAKMGAKHDQWQVPVVKAEAVRGKGIENVVLAIGEHQAYLNQSGQVHERAIELIRSELNDILQERLSNELGTRIGTSEGKAILDRLVKRQIDPYQAADQLMKS